MKKAGSVITVTDEIKPSETLVADKKDITLNMNGKTIVNDTIFGKKAVRIIGRWFLHRMDRA